jgi:hypothetical protein
VAVVINAFARKHPQERINCARCGADWPKTGSRRTYCDSCRPVVKRDVNRQHMRRRARREGVEAKVQEVRCHKCDATFVRQTAARRYCDVCSRASKLEGKRNASRKEPAAAKRLRQKRYYERHRERIASDRKMKPTTAEARERSNARQRGRRSNPQFVLHSRMTLSIRNCLKTGKGGRSWQELVGYSCDDLRRHLERQFLKGMSWERMGEWHIDHIIPASSFVFASAEDAEFKACWALTNLRPLWAEDNHRKGPKRLTLL